MNQHPQPHQRDDLSRLLQSWRIDERDDALLAKRVWHRIDADRSAQRSGGLAWLLAIFSKPLAACTAVALCVAVGGLLAATEQQRQREARLDRLASEYVRSIDPIQMTSHAGHGGM